MRICNRISVLVAGIAIAFSGSISTANETDDWASSFTAYNIPYVWVAENELSNLSPTVAHKPGSEAGEGINQIAEDAIVAEGERVVIRANHPYVVEFMLPAVELPGGGCAPVFRPGFAFGDDFLVLADLTIERIPSPGLGARTTDSGGYISFVDGVFTQSPTSYAGTECMGDVMMVWWDIFADRTVEHSFRVYMSFLADGARSSNGLDFGAQNEPPAGNYMTDFSAFLMVHPSFI